MDERSAAYALYRARAGVGAVPAVAKLWTAVVRSDCKYAQRHLDAAFAKRPWWRTVRCTDDATARGLEVDLLCDEYETIDWNTVMSPPHVVASSFCIRKGLSRKAQFARFMEKHLEKCERALAAAAAAAACAADGGAAPAAAPLVCPLRAGLPQTVLIDTMPVFVNRPAFIDFRSAMSDCLSDVDDAIAAGRCAACAAAHDAGTDASASASPCTACATWIMKPSLANKGAEVFLVRSTAEVEANVREWRDVGQWVLQRYLPNPLLLQPFADSSAILEAGGAASASSASAPPATSPGSSGSGHKFHLRVYVLADGAISVHVFQEGLVLIASEPFDAADISKTHAHITNTCVNTGAAAFVEEALVRSTAELPAMLVASGHCASLAEAGARVARMWADINDLTKHAFQAVKGDTSAYMPLPNAWELYGVDFLVDDRWQVSEAAQCSAVHARDRGLWTLAPQVLRGDILGVHEQDTQDDGTDAVCHTAHACCRCCCWSLTRRPTSSRPASGWTASSRRWSTA